MNDKLKNILWFAIPFIIVLGSYIVMHIAWNFNQSYGFIGAGLLGGLYLIIGIPLYFIFRNRNIMLARGVIWGVISMVIFVFTLGGCSVFR